MTRPTEPTSGRGGTRIVVVLAACLAVAWFGVVAPTRASATPRRQASERPLAVPANPQKPGRLIIPYRNLPDPFVVQVGSRYYLYASQTSLMTPAASLTESTGHLSLYHWGATQAALTTVPNWAENGFTWSPDVREIHGVWTMYFDAWARKSLYFNPGAPGVHARAQCIGIATAGGPAGPFTPVNGKPLVCQFHDHGAIDPRTFVDRHGRLWLDWKSDDNAFEVPRPTSLWAQRLSPHGLHLVGRRHRLLRGGNHSWDGGLIEAPDMVYADHQDWLFYSGSWFNGPRYSIGVAHCNGPAGPCVPVSGHPFLASNAEGDGPGEESLFKNSHGWWMVYSPWGIHANTYRPVELAKVDFGGFGPYLARF